MVTSAITSEATAHLTRSPIPTPTSPHFCFLTAAPDFTRTGPTLTFLPSNDQSHGSKLRVERASMTLIFSSFRYT